MISFTGQLILLDIEGTTSSVSFVYDEMFPLVLRELDSFLSDNATDADVVAACDEIAVDAGHESVELWAGQPLDNADSQATVAAEVRRLMENDVKATGLKQLQGVIWKSAFESGQLKAHVYDDVPPALRRWHDSGRTLRVYSSGSVQAQKLFFGHTIDGNLLPLFSGHNDTKTGGKREAASYAKIADEAGVEPRAMLFLSDIVQELNAAAAAGLQTGLVVRPGNQPIANQHDHPVIESFDAVQMS